jgi:hypothetical protein
MTVTQSYSIMLVDFHNNEKLCWAVSALPAVVVRVNLKRSTAATVSQIRAALKPGLSSFERAHTGRMHVLSVHRTVEPAYKDVLLSSDFQIVEALTKESRR